jgi:hypothetical protein
VANRVDGRLVAAKGPLGRVCERSSGEVRPPCPRHNKTWRVVLPKAKRKGSLLDQLVPLALSHATRCQVPRARLSSPSRRTADTDTPQFTAIRNTQYSYQYAPAAGPEPELPPGTSLGLGSGTRWNSKKKAVGFCCSCRQDTALDLLLSPPPPLNFLFCKTFSTWSFPNF